MSEFDAVPPHSLEAEAAILGSVLVDRDLLWDIRDVARAQDFYAHTHAAIYTAMLTLLDDGEPIDKITLANEIRKRSSKALEEIGGIAYLSKLMDTVQTAGSVASYAAIVREKSRCRALIEAGTRIRTLGYSGEDAVGEAEAAAARTLSVAIESGSADARMLTPRELLARYDRRIITVPTFLTPWPRLDALTSGFSGEELVVWAAEPGVGKTFALVMLAVYVAMTYGHVAFFGIEMGDFKMTQRFLAFLSGVSARKQKMPNALTEWEREKLAMARAAFLRLPITVSDEMMTSSEVVAQANRINRRDPLKAVFVDTLGSLADIHGSSANQRSSVHERQSTATWALKNLAKSLDCPVHAAHHFSGDAQNKKLRDGGGLQQWATTIIHMLRPKDGGPPRHHWKVDKARDGDGGPHVEMDLVGPLGRWLQADQQTCWLDPVTARQTETFFPQEEADLLEQFI